MEITRKDVEGHLKFLENGYKDSSVEVSVEYLTEVLKLALKSFIDKKENLDYET